MGEIIANGSAQYEVGKLVANSKVYQVYTCVQVATGKQCLLQVASTPAFNGELSRAAYILRELKLKAKELDDEYAKVTGDPEARVGYDLQFPTVIDSFVSTRFDGCLVDVLAFNGVEELIDLVPLSNITAKDRQRVDLRTSAWIMGKTLKLFVFTHSNRVANPQTTGKNTLIHPENHYVMRFDWTSAVPYPNAIPLQVRQKEIATAAKAVITALGGDLGGQTIPYDGDEAFTAYTDYLWKLADGHEGNAKRAHEKFYELIDGFWKREYYPFTTLPL